MGAYRAIVHYHFKKGMEEQGIRFIENELLKNAAHYGCHDIEILFNEREPTHVIGIANWSSFEEAKKFQKAWGAREKELERFCVNIPKHEFFKLRRVYSEKAHKVA